MYIVQSVVFAGQGCPGEKYFSVCIYMILIMIQEQERYIEINLTYVSLHRCTGVQVYMCTYVYRMS